MPNYELRYLENYQLYDDLVDRGFAPNLIRRWQLMGMRTMNETILAYIMKPDKQLFDITNYGPKAHEITETVRKLYFERGYT